MTTVRKIAAVGAAPLVLVVAMAGPAAAHGSLTSPISRTVACGQENGKYAGTRACRAARAVSDAQALRAWDNLRVPNVNGRDRQLIPDGKLCSGGLAAYQGLDLPRRDWPATRLTSGARFTFAYKATIPHAGMFKLYITRNGYNPARRLRWSDLESRPLATVTDAPLRDGSYIIKGRLPHGKSGRHVIFAIWQTTSTPDTYYSCSDVVFGGHRQAAGQGKAAPSPRSTESAGVGDLSASPDAGADDGTVNTARPTAHSSLPLATGGGALALVLAGGATFLLARRRRARRPAGWQGPADQGEETW